MLERTLSAGGETVHAVLLKQASRGRWNAFLWSSRLRFANTFARRESALRWLEGQLRRRFGVSARLVAERPPRPAAPGALRHAPRYRL